MSTRTRTRIRTRTRTRTRTRRTRTTRRTRRTRARQPPLESSRLFSAPLPRIGGFAAYLPARAAPPSPPLPPLPIPPPHPPTHTLEDAGAMRARMNQEFQNFVKKVEEQAKDLEFDIPYRDLGFYGVPNKSTSFIMPAVNALVELTEPPVRLTPLHSPTSPPRGGATLPPSIGRPVQTARPAS